MAYRETISKYEHRGERLNRLCNMNQFTDNFLRGQTGRNHNENYSAVYYRDAGV